MARLPRALVVVADDYGIGPATSEGILKLCHAGVVTGTVLLVNSPHAADAVRAWNKVGPNADLGWHPCLTLDAPILPAQEVPSLVAADGRFPRLGTIVKRALSGRLNHGELVAEFGAQLRRFRELTGAWPSVVNSHHHVQIFPAVGRALREVLAVCRPLPYLRCVRESWRTLIRVPGARGKRTFLSSFGRSESRRQIGDGFPGNDWLAGITDPPYVHDSRFFARWLRRVPGSVVELTCHPGLTDPTILGRDAMPGDGNIERRAQEFALLSRSDFRDAVSQNAFRLTRPSEIGRLSEAQAA
ncbi:MAG: carbohydrate deacetylase [Gemmataceae bacterium]